MQSPQSESDTSLHSPTLSYANDATQYATLAEVTAVVIRICAAITFFQLLGWVSYVASMFPRVSGWREVAPLLFMPVMQIIAATALWFFANPLSRFFAPPRALPLVAAGRDMNRLQRIAFGTVGVLILTFVIPEFANAMYFYMARSGSDSDPGYLIAPPTIVLVGHLLQILIALWLILGNQRLIAFWRRLRSPNFRSD